MPEEASPANSAGISLEQVVRFIDIAVDALAEAREEIDALNVYPVPDGDTGTNMYLTVVAARDAVRAALAEPDGSPLTAFARGALLGARGNSGVILSSMLRGIADAVRAELVLEADAGVLALATVASAEHAFLIPLHIALWTCGRVLFWLGYHVSLRWRAPGFDWTLGTALMTAVWLVVEWL